MRRVFSLAVIVAACGLTALAQAEKDYPKYEFFVGYSNLILDNDHCGGVRVFNGDCVNAAGSPQALTGSRVGMSGLHASAVRNFSRLFGAKADFTAHFKSSSEERTRTFAFGDVVSSERVTGQRRDGLYQLLVGPELKLRSGSRVTPFANLLVGAARYSGKVDEVGSLSLTGGGMFQRADWAGTTTFGDTKPAGAVGGGVDVRVSGRTSIRTSVDYNPTYLNQGPLLAGGGTQNNIRTSVGVLFR
jgi:hypothetical protein